MKKIRILGIAIIVGLLLGLGTSVAAQEEVPVSINAPDRVMPGSDFTATVDIGAVVDLNAVQYDVSFDNTVLRLDDVTAGQIDGTEIPVAGFNEISPGTWRVVHTLVLDTVSGSGYLSVLHFHALQAGESDISLSNGILSGLEAEIPATWTGDSVLVASIIAISVEPTSVDFGDIIAGHSSDPQIVTVTNAGNVAEDFSATLDNISEPDVYTDGLAIGGSLVADWAESNVAVEGFVELPLVLMLPPATPSGTHTATLVFWAEVAGP